MEYDVVIVGAGVVGLACAQRLAEDGRSVLLVERHGSFGRETSSRNSEVIHAGMYYPTGSLKASLCVPGNRAMYAWCERWGIRHARPGKYIVATSEAEEAQLDVILGRARANGVSSLTRVTGDRVRADEPRVNATAALWSPETGIVDSHGFMASLLQLAQDRGADVAWKHTLIGVEHSDAGYSLRLAAPDGEPIDVAARSVVNSGGLDADRVAGLVGVDVEGCGYRQTFVKGNYFRLRGSGVVKHLIYPVPPSALAGLGIHVTLDLDGGARLGPDVEPLSEREQHYDVSEALAPKFLAAASRYLSGVTLDDLSPDQSGIRPKLRPPDGGSPDFVIAEESGRGLPRWVNLIGIESPGLTCSLPISERVAALLR